MKTLLLFLFGEVSREEAKHENIPPINYPPGFCEWAKQLNEKR